MRRILSCSALALATAFPAAAQDGASPILDGPRLDQYEGQNVDPNAELLRRLREAAIPRPSFSVSPASVTLKGEVGARLGGTVRLRNTGGSARILDISSIGVFDGLSVSDTCPERIGQEARDDGAPVSCDIEIRFSSDRARSIETAILLDTDLPAAEGGNISVPVVVEVAEPEIEDPDPEPVVTRRPEPPPVEEPEGPTSEDIARRYFGAIGGMRSGPIGSRRGFAVVSGEKPDGSAEIAGVGVDELRVETATSQDRYADQIPATDASLPVERDRILTTDRVIKAVLETPVSNVMCNKTVAMVESDVYSATSKRPLIPAGSRVVGTCREFVDERVGIAWERIITTDGRSITFEDEDADTRDATGLGGAVGRIYQSRFDKYVLPIFSTMIDTAAGVVFATFGDDETVVVDENGKTIKEESARNEGTRIVTDEARGTAQKIISDVRDVREVAVIPKGSRVDIEINEDIYFADSRRVVRLADMTFDLDSVGTGEAVRDLPEGLTLVPAERGFEGPTAMVAGRRYRIEERGGAGKEDGQAAANPRTRAVLDDLAAPARGTE